MRRTAGIILAAVLACPAVAAAAVAEKIDLKKTATYRLGQWEYRYRVTAAGTRNEGRRGLLHYDGKALPEPGFNDYYRTPWGSLYWVGDPNMIQGDHCWMPHASRIVKRKGRLLPDPGAAKPAADPASVKVELTEADSGKTLRAVVGNKLELTLRGNPTTGYRWIQKELTGGVLRVAEKLAYRRGGGRTYRAVYQAVRPGEATLELHHRRPWEKSKRPSRTFKATVVVRAAEAGTQGIAGRVLKLRGNFMPGPVPAPLRPKPVPPVPRPVQPGGPQPVRPLPGPGVRPARATIPLSVPVHVFKGKVKPFKRPNPKHAKLVKIVTSGKDGVYRAAVPPGEYTVVAVIGGRMYLNLYVSSGHWATVKVASGKWTTFDIQDTSQAAF